MKSPVSIGLNVDNHRLSSEIKLCAAKEAQRNQPQRRRVNASSAFCERVKRRNGNAARSVVAVNNRERNTQALSSAFRVEWYAGGPY
jgi:cupin superfamily acireductone dioxygenase involved in methionine salvage